MISTEKYISELERHVESFLPHAVEAMMEETDWDRSPLRFYTAVDGIVPVPELEVDVLCTITQLSKDYTPPSWFPLDERDADLLCAWGVVIGDSRPDDDGTVTTQYIRIGDKKARSIVENSINRLGFDVPVRVLPVLLEMGVNKKYYP